MDSLFESYQRELSKSKYDPIDDREKVKTLIRNFQDNGNIDAFNTLVYTNMRFVVYLLKEYNLPINMSIMDIIQAGNYGLICGIKRINIKKYPDIKLFSYAVWWIRLYIRTELANNLKHQKGRSELMTDEALESSTRLNKDDQDIYGYYDNNIDVTDQVAFDDINDFLLEYLDKREAAIIRLYYGIGPDSQLKTLEAIGQQLHIKFVRVRQLRDRAVEKLRQALDGNMFDRYF